MNTIKDNKRRDFMRVVGLGAIVTASTAFAARGSKKPAALTEEQKDTLFFIFQEEKVARDVYITLGKIYTDESTFAQIQISEQEHILSAQVLFERYGMDSSSVYLSLGDDFV